MLKKINRTLLFLVLTFTVNYSIVGIYYLSGGRYDQVSGLILATVYMFIPMLSALMVEKFIHKEKIKDTLKISFRINQWFLIAWLITPVLGFITFGISLLFPDVTYSPDMAGIMEKFESMMSPEQIEEMQRSMETLPLHPFWLTLIQGLLAGITVNAVAGFGEESGWRGFLLKEFRNMSFFRASLLIGFIWGIWHAPLILLGHNYPQHPGIGVIMMVLWCVLLTPIFNYITLKSGSVIAASILHGTLNGTAGIPILLIEGGNDLTVGISGLAGFITLIVAIFGFFAYDCWISRERIMYCNIGNHHNNIHSNFNSEFPETRSQPDKP